MDVDLAGLRVLLLQGPNGPFFGRLQEELEQAGAEVTKVHLNLAEEFFHGGRPATPYLGSAGKWPDFLDTLVQERCIDCCMYFGDTRPYHIAARDVLERRGIPYFVFEDGYLRPDFVTVEEGGVNFRSSLKTQGIRAEEVHAASRDGAALALPEVLPVRHAFGWSVLHTIVNSLMVTFGQVFFPRYRHHRDVQTGRQALLWGRSFLRKAIYHFREQSTFEEIKGPLWGKYFLIGLQVYNDSQVKLSRFTDVRDFIDEVLVSFSSAAPSDAYLVFKHHPADRAYRDYAEFILERASALKIGDRVRYVHDLHLPTLLEGARGTVVINSTIGWSSLHHKTPVYALDEATYGYVGLAAAGKLDDFWGDPPAVAPHLTRAMQHHLRATTQANGSVWVRLPGARATGFRWPPAFEKRLVELTVQAKMRSPKSPASSE